jgi:hypothetical protein
LNGLYLNKFHFVRLICLKLRDKPDKSRGINKLAASNRPMTEFQRLYKNLSQLKEPYCKVNFRKNVAFKACVVASFSKAVDLGVSLFKEADKEDAYFKTASLRGLCEEIIVLLYIDNMLKPHQNDIVMNLVALNLAKDLKSQEDFFSDNHPEQYVLDSKFYSDLDTPKDKIKTIINSKGINGNKLPPVEQMAEKVNLSELYSYMYRATSNFVHFNPAHLIRMGWGKKPGESTFKASHFYEYYLWFNRFYISYLLTVFCKVFKEKLKLKGDIWKVLKKIEKELQTYLTWPEIVTFEEMNLKRPSEILTLLRLSQKKLTSS